MKYIFLGFFFGFILPLIISSPSEVQVVAPTPTISITITPTPSPTPVQKLIYIPDLPFTSQAPFGDWNDPRQQDGCEEAASLMAVYWARSQPLTPQSALDKILEIAQYQVDNYGSFVDTSAIDTQKRIIRGYFGFDNSQVVSIETVQGLITPLSQGKLVIVPTNGRLLGNPNFTAPGPERHNLVLRGYDPVKKEFITNDPGTRRGENYRYPQDILFNALRDYPTGDHLPITSFEKTAIIVGK